MLHKRVRIAGIEPASSPWQREILPFDHIRYLLFMGVTRSARLLLE